MGVQWAARHRDTRVNTAVPGGPQPPERQQAATGAPANSHMRCDARAGRPAGTSRRVDGVANKPSHLHLLAQELRQTDPLGSWTIWATLPSRSCHVPLRFVCGVGGVGGVGGWTHPVRLHPSQYLVPARTEQSAVCANGAQAQAGCVCFAALTSPRGPSASAANPTRSDHNHRNCQAGNVAGFLSLFFYYVPVFVGEQRGVPWNECKARKGPPHSGQAW